jgi:hypothetical protein
MEEKWKPRRKLKNISTKNFLDQEDLPYLPIPLLTKEMYMGKIYRLE